MDTLVVAAEAICEAGTMEGTISTALAAAAIHFNFFLLLISFTPSHK
jgi:hypothetical protein